MNKDVATFKNTLLADLNDADDPSEAIANIEIRLESFGDGHEAICFENAYDLPAEFRSHFYYLTLLNPADENMKRETNGSYSLPFTTHYFTDMTNELDQYAYAVASYLNDTEFHAWDRIKLYAENNDGKHWLFIPSHHRDGSKSVRKATWNDAKRAYKVAYKLTIGHFLKITEHEL